MMTVLSVSASNY